MLSEPRTGKTASTMNPPEYIETELHNSYTFKKAYQINDVSFQKSPKLQIPWSHRIVFIIFDIHGSKSILRNLPSKHWERIQSYPVHRSIKTLTRNHSNLSQSRNLNLRKRYAISILQSDNTAPCPNLCI